MRPALLVMSLALPGAGLAAQEWTRLRGQAGQGHGAADLPASFTAENVRWRVDVGGTGHSSPVLWGSRLFLTRVADGPGQREVVCFDADTGKELWASRQEFESHDQHQLNSFATSTPAVDGSAVYVLWTSGSRLVALALDHGGEEVWQRELGGFYSNHGSAMSPVLCGDRVIVANDNQGDDCFLTALDRATGEPTWRIEREKKARWANYSPPFVCRTETGDLVVVASSSHGLTAIEPESGEIRWQADPGFKYRFIAAPARSGDSLLVNTGAGDAGRECVVFELAESMADAPKVRYRLRRGLPYVPSVIGLDGRFFLFSDSGFASCVDAATGDELWRERTGSKFFSSPVTNGEVIYIADREGRLLTYSKAGFEVLGTFDLGAPVFATPALARGAMFVRTAEELWCLGPAGGD